ncbi:MAG: RNA polymerase factor sigma-54 [Spirochaetaceae bacterium]|nr:RNA polymerase factor sigma-54 [Spirochaetaceae bacterium]
MKLSPQMYQTIQLLALPALELKIKIDEEVEKNPALEVVEQNSNLSLDDFSKKSSDGDDYSEESSDPGVLSQADNNNDSKRMFIEGALSRPPSLQDYLLEQLLVQPVKKTILEIGKLLIQNLNEDGFNIEKIETFTKGYLPKDINKAISLVRVLDPQGTSTDNFKESLIAQAKINNSRPPHTVEIIENYFELLEKGKYKEIAKKINISERKVMKILDYIKTLNPFPGRQFSTETTIYVIPDLMITILNNEIIIKLNEEEIPVLSINQEFSDLYKNRKKIADKNAVQFVNSKIKEAELFISNVNLRNQTLLKTAEAIVHFQKEFFIKGPKFLAPLTLRDISEQVGVHETTISRISNKKYVQTDWGIYEIKYFFSTSLSRTDSRENMVSRVSAKHIIKEIIEEKGKGKHLSDQSIADFLKEKKGIKIARRTIAKYRKELDIASSYER